VEKKKRMPTWQWVALVVLGTVFIVAWIISASGTPTTTDTGTNGGSASAECAALEAELDRAQELVSDAQARGDAAAVADFQEYVDTVLRNMGEAGC
jgi:hypothetical protein